MYLSINVLGERIANPYKPKECHDDFFKFGYYRDVLDSSKNFKQTNIEEVDGGTWKNGITTIQYASKNGGKLTLDIDGGFPVPELADMTLQIDELTDKTLKDIVCAFEQYHKTKLTHFEIEYSGQLGSQPTFVSIQLFDKHPLQLKQDGI